MARKPEGQQLPLVTYEELIEENKKLKVQVALLKKAIDDYQDKQYEINKETLRKAMCVITGHSWGDYECYNCDISWKEYKAGL